MATKNKKNRALYQGITLVIAPHSHKNTYRIIINKYIMLFVYMLILFFILFGAFTFIQKARLYTLRKKVVQSYTESQKLQFLLDTHREQINESIADFRQHGYSLYKTIWGSNKIMIEDENNDYSANVTLSLSDSYLKQVRYLEKSILFIKQQQEVFENLPLGWPVKAGFISSTYGYRPSPFGFTEEFHSGYDFANTVGTPVYATGEGIVEFAGTNGSGYGTHVKIIHKYGFSTLYGHGLVARVVKDQKVKRGDLIMLLGQSGNVTGPHTHYEVRLNTSTIETPFEIMLNPIHFLKMYDH